eukprot:2960051-Amphidinium_carterae.1
MKNHLREILQSLPTYRTTSICTRRQYFCKDRNKNYPLIRIGCDCTMPFNWRLAIPGPPLRHLSISVQSKEQRPLSSTHRPPCAQHSHNTHWRKRNIRV